MKEQLEALGLEKSYHKRKVVDKISIYVKRGEVVGLLGSNGAGKTTTFSMIVGLVPQDKGEIILDGENVTRIPMYMRARKGMCLLPQESSAFRKLSVEDNLYSIIEMSNGGYSIMRSRVNQILKEMGLKNLLRSKAYTLSGGERRRLEIARALITDPDYILLDEPFTGIDPLAILDLQEIIQALKDKGLGLLITDHSVRETLKITDRAYIIEKGKILKEGTSQDIVVSDEVRKSYLGENFELD